MANETSTVDPLALVSNRLAALGNPEPEAPAVLVNTNIPTETEDLKIIAEKAQRRETGKKLAAKEIFISGLYEQVTQILNDQAIVDPEVRAGFKEEAAGLIALHGAGFVQKDQAAPPESFSFSNLLQKCPTDEQPAVMGLQNNILGILDRMDTLRSANQVTPPAPTST